jgi:6-phospho-beta-glucosidase
VRLAIIGGGGFRVPLVYGAVLRGRRGFDDVVLHDVDAGRLERIGLVLEGQAAAHGHHVPVRTTGDLDDALEGADFVFVAIRVGGLEGRTVDEGVPLGHGVLGQETIGPGGICFALRTIPAMLELAERVARRAPDAWLVNFTNPAGMVTEALQQVLGDRAIGICDTPSGLCRRVAAALGRDTAELSFDYFGLNHLGWLKGVRDGGGGDLLPGLLADDDALARLEEGRVFGAEWLRSLGMIPNEYLSYFYFAEDTVNALSEKPRGAYLLEQQASFYASRPESPAAALAEWKATKSERDRTYMAEARNGHEPAPAAEDEPGGYEVEAMAVVDAIASNAGTVRILNAANRSALPFLDERAVVEVPCVVGAAGARPLAVGTVPEHARALIDTIKAVERATIEAAVTGSTALAVKALALHPLVPSVTAAREIFAEYRQRLPALEERFA